MTNASAINSLSIPGDDKGPVFEEPWHAQAFALAVELRNAGMFTWPEWAEVFSNEIKSSPAMPHEGVNEAYYRQWISALVTVVETQKVLNGADIDTRTEEWRQAYLNTPHGQPVMLENSSCISTPHDEDHHHLHYGHSHAPRRAPVMISPAR